MFEELEKIAIKISNEPDFLDFIKRWNNDCNAWISTVEYQDDDHSLQYGVEINPNQLVIYNKTSYKNVKTIYPFSYWSKRFFFKKLQKLAKEKLKEQENIKALISKYSLLYKFKFSPKIRYGRERQKVAEYYKHFKEQDYLIFNLNNESFGSEYIIFFRTEAEEANYILTVVGESTAEGDEDVN